MCGIAGLIAEPGAPIDLDRLRAMAAAIAHRGPDGEGIHQFDDGRTAFVHRRLAIIDPEARSDQPMHSADGSHSIVFNGEIFNFVELRAELQEKGHRFVTEGDTEVLLAAWREWGEGMLLRLNGMWALVIRDNRDGSLFLARDRFGIKPLLYASRGQQFAFASEMRALLTLPWAKSDVDRDIARRVLFDPFGIEGSEQSLFPAIRRVPGGHWARLSPDGALTVRRWWRTVDHLRDVPNTLAGAAEEFRELFFASTRLRMRSDVPIATCLSGGFDSSAVVTSMARIAQENGGSNVRQASDWRRAFVATFPGLAHDETAEARLAAGAAGVEPRLFDLSNDDPLVAADPVMDALDDIYISLPSAIWQIYRAVRRGGAVVTLDGHGADEAFGGYRAAGKPANHIIRNFFGNGVGRSDAMVGLSEFAKLQNARAKGAMFLRGAAVMPPPGPSIAAQSDQLPDSWSNFDRRLYGMFHATTLPTILRNFDRLSMAHGVEIRMPFMDWRLVTYIMSLEPQMKEAGGLTKLVAREAMRGIVPEEIRASPRKVGFNSQMPDWMNGVLGPWALAQIEARPHPLFEEIVDVPALKSRIATLNAKSAWDWYRSDRIWPYINLNWFLNRHAPAH